MNNKLIRRVYVIGQTIRDARREGRDVFTRNRRLVLITDNRQKMQEIRAARGMS